MISNFAIECLRAPGVRALPTFIVGAAIASAAVASGVPDDDGLAEAAKVIGSRKSRAAARAAYESVSLENRVPVTLMPLVGATKYVGPVSDAVGPSVATGLAVELGATAGFSVEIEGGFENSALSYRAIRADGALGGQVGHHFQRAQLGMNLKSYVARGFFNPYIGAGFHGVRYGNLSHGPEVEGGSAPFEQWVGAAQAVAGIELALSDDFSLGARASFTQPVANLPTVEMTAGRLAPGNEQLAFTRVGYLRFFGAAKIAL